MCGIAGFLGSEAWQNAEPMQAILHRMAAAIASRGPDSFGVWNDSSSNVGLAHRRLAVLDLSSAGAQPMQSASGRYVIVFNGEVYNHLDIRRDLQHCGRAPIWRGHSDTETLLAGFEAWGFVKTLRLCAGMFAFAVWDRQDRMLTLARDRIGEKPLYYGLQERNGDSYFLFGSELKALKKHPVFGAEVDRNALCLMLRHNYVPSPYSIYQGIKKLEPGCLLQVPLDAVGSKARKNLEFVPQAYWSLFEVAKNGVSSPYCSSAEQAVDELDDVLRTVIKQQMLSDVPLGAFLSGGVDSSVIVALMQAESRRPVRTFTIGFHEGSYNEAVHAERIAKHLGTDHTELYVSPEDSLAVIPKLPELYDEPFADSSQIPTYLVSQLARQDVTVALSGDGGDELFCGYTRYLAAANTWHTLSKIPVPVRTIAARCALLLSPRTWDLISDIVPLLKDRFGGRFGDQVHKAAGVLDSRSIDELYEGLVSHWNDPGKLVLDGNEPPTRLANAALELSGLNPVEKMMALDMVSYLPDDILVKVDRAAMAVSLETRVPFLDHRVVEFAWQLPYELKQQNGQGKWALRQVLYRYVPRSMIERPKMGFGIPLGEWLSGPLRDWAEELLDEKRLRKEGFFESELVREKWEQHLKGERNWAYHLWGILMFQAWLEKERA